MFDFIKKAFGMTPVDYKELVKNGAKIIDVRTQMEYKGGHIRNSACIPLDRLNNECKKFKKDQVIITCCASGARSGAARRMLKSQGYSQVYNGGSWMRLQNKLRG